LSKLDQQLDGISDSIKFEEVFFLLQIEKDLANNDPQGEVQDGVLEFRNRELEVGLQHSLQELDKILDLDQVNQMILQVLSAIEDGDQKVLEHTKLIGVKQSNNLDERE
jgi:hypothetical protein